MKLAQAFELGDEDTFRAMLASRPNLVATLSDEDRRRLPDAAQNNNTGAVRLMLQAGWPVEAQGEYGLTPLAWASWHGNAEMVREILRYHPQLERNDCEYGQTALGSALHGSENSWHRDTGDYAATVEALTRCRGEGAKTHRRSGSQRGGSGGSAAARGRLVRDALTRFARTNFGMRKCRAGRCADPRRESCAGERSAARADVSVAGSGAARREENREAGDALPKAIPIYETAGWAGATGAGTR